VAVSVTLIRSGAVNASAGATTITPAKPTVDGSKGRMLAILCTKNNATHSTTTTGWSNLAQVNSGASFTVSIWEAPETSANPVFTWTGSVACEAAIWYFADPNNPMAALAVGSTANTGSANPHTSTSFNASANDVLAVCVDGGAAATNLNLPSGWGNANNKASATSGTALSVCTKAIATSGSASGAVSVNGAAAAWVQWQLEAKIVAAAAGETSKLEDVAVLEPTDGLSESKLEVVAVLEGTPGDGVSKMEAVAWLDKLSGEWTKLEVDALLEPPPGLDASKLEVVAWLDGPGGGNRRMSLM
jgi:hypothetical protein